MNPLKASACIILNFLSLIVLMKLPKLLNIGNLFYNVLAIIGLILILSVLIKTRLFTKFNFKTKNKNEKNS